MHIIKQASQGVTLVKERSFNMKDMPGCGYAFDLDKQNNPILTNPYAEKNYLDCLRGTNDKGELIIDNGIKTRKHYWNECAIGKCSCGMLVHLSGFTNTCDRCGNDYNMSGQLLAPREQWGEETGEHYVDIARI